MQGSGWGVLAWDPMAGRLFVEQVYDHQGNVGQSAAPLLVLDAWEHAFYLQYKNVKADYVDAVLEHRQLGRRGRPVHPGAEARHRQLRVRPCAWGTMSE